MIIRKIRIKNFRSYYDENEFELSEGLTLIIGGNGDGKTTFFEALEWLFDTTTENKKEAHVSEKRKSELEIGETDEVAVSMVFEHNGEKELVKRFDFQRVNESSVVTRNYQFIGYGNRGAERYSFDGKKMLEECFETLIRKYCLFKGESELNVFDNPEALKTLVDTFSGIKQFDRFVSLTTDFEQKSLKAATQELKNDKKVSDRAKELESQLVSVNREIQDYRTDLKNQEKAVSDYSEKLKILEENQEISERYQDIKGRLKSLYDKRARLTAQSGCDYNTSLLDEYWILRSFPKVLDEFQAKVSKLSKQKRKLDKEETERRAMEKGKKEAVKNLMNGAAPLPWYVPNKETMQEMIDEEVCKVCGRPAPKDSDAYHFMVDKLNEYLRHLEKENQADEEKPFFPNSYVDELHTRQIKMSGEIESEISNIHNEISDRIDFINARKSDLEKVKKEIQDVEDERTRILVNTNLTEDLIEKDFNDFKGYFAAKGRAETRIVELNQKLAAAESRKSDIQTEMSKLQPASSMTQAYQNVHIALERIMKAFERAKNENVNSFIGLLEKEANNYLEMLNENDFYGIIRIIKTVNDSARICLFSENGTEITNPGGAMRTTMYMSVLFAISKITTLKREQDYPLIFDAPTSSFEDYKEDVFYNVIDKIDKQCIIVTKDLLKTDELTGEKVLNDEKINQLTCSVYRICKAPNYNDKDLSTIQTMITHIK